MPLHHPLPQNDAPSSANGFRGIAKTLPDFDVQSEGTFYRAVLDGSETPMVVICAGFRVQFANRSFLDFCGTAACDIEYKNIFELFNGSWNVPGLRATASRLLKAGDGTAENEITAAFGAAGMKTVCIHVRRINPNQQEFLLLSFEDRTGQKRTEHLVSGERERLQSSLNQRFAELKQANEVLQAEIGVRVTAETALRESEAALLRSRETLRHLSASLMYAQDVERRRVSRELHDDLSQKVAKLQFDIETLEQKVPFDDPESAKQRLRDVGQLAAALSVDLRRVAHQLHPATLDHLGLCVALKSYTEEFSRSTAIRVKFTSIQVPSDIPIETASALFRIVQEALRNVGKHTSNAAVEIVLARTPGGLTLFIRDSGDGFDVEQESVKNGLGLISMQERVRLLDGTFSLQTKPGKGVLLKIQCPLGELKS